MRDRGVGWEPRRAPTIVTRGERGLRLPSVAGPDEHPACAGGGREAEVGHAVADAVAAAEIERELAARALERKANAGR